MVSEVASAVVSASSGGILSTLFLLLRIAFWSWVIIIFFLSSIIKGVESHDPSVAIYDLGNKFLLVSSNLNTKSLDIINGGFKYEGFFKSIYNLSTFLNYAIILYLWIRLLAFIISHSPLSNTSSVFKNYFYAIVIFALIEIFASLIYAGITKNITSYLGKENSALYFIMLPFSSLWNFLRAFYIVIKPVVLYFSK